MKKKYEKPMVLFEDFTMSMNIATVCEVTTNLQGYQECGIKASDLDLSNSGIYDDTDIIFTSTEYGCSYTMSQFNKVCYDVPTTDNNLFAS